MTDKEQIIIDTNKYFVEIIDESKSTIGYTVVFPEKLLTEIMKQNKQLARKTQECKELEIEKEELNNRMAEVIYRATGGRLSYSNYTLDAIEQAFNDQLEVLSDQKVEEETKELKQELYLIQNEIHSKTEYIQEQREYIKQLEQKYELLEGTNKIHVDTLNQLNDKYNDLEEDNKELKEENNKLIKFNEVVKDIFAPNECDLDDEEILYMFRELKKWDNDAFKCWEELNDILHGDYRYYGIDPEYIVDLVKKLRLRFSHKLREYKRYRKALEEIEEIGGICPEFDSSIKRIYDIINKVKG